MPATWSLQTSNSPGAVAIIQLAADSGPDLDAALARLNIITVSPGQVTLRDLCGIDQGLVARWNDTSVHLMPHGGAAVIRALIRAFLLAAGIPQAVNPDPRSVYPEAQTLLEARMLATLARAASPLAVDLLLDQPRRWAHLADEAGSHPAPEQLRLARLIDPPLVVAIGPPNIGKSSLLNALAGRDAAIVADQPGTTRDHIGVQIDMAGLVVRYIDTPGIRAAADPIEAEAALIASELLSKADLILSCGDRTSPPVDPGVTAPKLVIATRTDLGIPAWRHDAAVSALTGHGIPDLVTRIRETLVPSSALLDPPPWRFWD